jgi:RimJ/RimL family protein N-acetyltransferase
MKPIVLPDPIRGERVVLRLWQPQDVPTMYEICQDPDVQKWSDLPVPYLMKHAEAYINDAQPKEQESGTGVSLAITVDGGQTIAGGTGLYSIRARTAALPSTASARVWLAPAHRRSGIAAEAVRLLAAWAFAELRLDRIVTYSHAGNTAARRVTHLVGFRNHATLRAAVLRDGNPADLWYSDLVPADLAPERTSEFRSIRPTR